jgi:hypothetical protein
LDFVQRAPANTDKSGKFAMALAANLSAMFRQTESAASSSCDRSFRSARNRPLSQIEDFRTVPVAELPDNQLS